MEVEKQLKSSSNPYIQKKTLLVALRSVRKVPDLLATYLPYVKQSLTDKNPSIVLAGLSLALEMIQVKPKLKKKFGKVRFLQKCFLFLPKMRFFVKEKLCRRQKCDFPQF